MVKEGFFVTEPTRVRQGYRTEPLYRHTFTLLLVIAASAVVTVLLLLFVHVLEAGQAEDEARVAAQESQVRQEEDKLHPVTVRIEALAALRNRIEKRTPATRILAAVEAAVAASPDVCVRQINLESASDERNPADIDRWSLQVQAVTRVPDRQVISGFRAALSKELGRASVSISEPPNFALPQPPFSLQAQYPR